MEKKQILEKLVQYKQISIERVQSTLNWRWSLLKRIADTRTKQVACICWTTWTARRSYSARRHTAGGHSTRGSNSTRGHTTGWHPTWRRPLSHACTSHSRIRVTIVLLLIHLRSVLLICTHLLLIAVPLSLHGVDSQLLFQLVFSVGWTWDFWISLKYFNSFF